MKGSKRDDWPGIPAGLKYMDLRLPGTFRELVANENFSDAQIGRIIRCLALDTDYFLKHDIEVEVRYYRSCLVARNNQRLRIQEYRRRKRDGRAGVLSGSLAPVQPADGEGKVENDDLQKQPKPQNGETATVAGDAEKSRLPSDDTSSCSEKTPSDLKEKHPPIVPPKKKAPVSLEKARRDGNREAIAAGIQSDLFAAAFGVEDGGRVPGDVPASPETGQGSPQKREEGSGGATAPQDIERAPTGVSALPTAKVKDMVVDSRNDMAWIPERFAAFWSQYPKKVAKYDALKAFTKLIKTQPDIEKFMATLMASLEWWKKQQTWTKDGGKYIPHPATWLNRGNWEDSKENSVVSGTTGDAKYLSMDNESTEDLLRRMRGG